MYDVRPIDVLPYSTSRMRSSAHASQLYGAMMLKIRATPAKPSKPQPPVWLGESTITRIAEPFRKTWLKGKIATRA